MEDLKINIKCRDKQIDLLSGLIGDQEDLILPSSLFLYGHGSTGKSLVTVAILEKLNVQICRCNCVEFYSSKILFETILNQLSGTVLHKDNNYLPYASCDSLEDFVRHVKAIASTPDGPKRMTIMLEHSERLRDCDANIFPVLCRLQELVEGINIMVVFMSTLPFDKFRSSIGVMEPIIIHFPQYSKEELIQILLADCPQDFSVDFYKNYIHIVLSVFYIATKNLNELKRLIKLNFSKYCAPIKNGEATEDDLRLLWKNIEPSLKKALSTVYLREVSSEQFLKMQQITDNDSGSKSMITGPVKMELPYYSKFLLIASYLASYNPAKSDKRFFMKYHGKQRKTQAIIKAKERSSSQLVGPKPFPLDRMLAIFYSIIEEKVAPTANVFSQIMTLVTLRLITQIGGDDQIDSPKYKSAVGLDFIRQIARTVDFDVIRYLYDFV